jgi:hypothetical protein
MLIIVLVMKGLMMRFVYIIFFRVMILAALILILVGLYTSGTFQQVGILIYRFAPNLGLLLVQSPTLSDRSIRQLSAVTQPVSIEGYYSDTDLERQRSTELLLRAFSESTPNITYRLMNMDETQSVSRTDITTSGTLYITHGEQKTSTQDITEAGIVRAIVKVAQTQNLVVYVVGGHGERSVDDVTSRGISRFRDLLKNRKIDVQPINNLKNLREVTSVNSVLLIASPQQELSVEESQIVIEFFQNGGYLIILSDPISPAPLIDLMATWGLEWQNDMIVDQQSQLGNPLAPAVLEYPYNDITRDLTGQASVFNAVRSIKQINEQAVISEDADVRVLLQSSTESSAATDFANGQVAVKESDLPGPLTFGYAITVGQGRAVVIGDADFISNGYINDIPANGQLVTYIIEWMIY